jgi:hypothetical protein
MKEKYIIFEQQTPEDPNSVLLRRALDLGCLDVVRNAPSPKGLEINPTPIKNNDGVFVLKAKGRKSGKTFNILIDPQVIVEEGNESNSISWSCPALNDKKQMVQGDLEKLRSSREAQRGVECVQTFKQLYSNYIATRDSGASFDPTVIKRVRDNAQACLSEPSIKQKLMLGKIPFLNQRFEKILADLKNINPNDTKLQVFRMNESDEISKLIKKTLQETKKLKEKKQIEKTIFESRMALVFEGLENFESLKKTKKIKTSFKTLKEIHNIQNLGLIEETLGTLFKGMYGKSFENSIGSISEPLFNLIFEKISLENELKNAVMDNIGSKISELIASMNSCFDLSKFLADIITEEYARKLDEIKSTSTNIVHSSLMDAVDDEMFRKNLQVKLESVVCALYEKFTENAKNLMVRMTAL